MPTLDDMSVMTEGELMKACGPLYGSFAIESAAGVVMGSMFFYLWLKISTKSELKAPLRAICRLAWYSFRSSGAEFYAHVKTWRLMGEATLAERFTLVKKLSQAVLLFRGFTAFLAITRWLHINNVNGFRWLAYACTCPIMQSQLVIMIAPVVPCYKIVVRFTLGITLTMLLIGWAANLQTMHFLDCSFDDVLRWEDFCFDWTLKFNMVLVAGSILMFLNFVHIPCLAILYLCKGGGNNKLLPHGYLKLLAIVICTWLSFPIWWFLSYEGIGYFQDTKMNAVGFAILNLISKGTMAFHILQMSQAHSLEVAAAGDTKIARELGMYRPRSGSTSSLLSSSSSGGQPGEVRAALSVTAWLMKILRNFDDGACMQPPQQTGSKEADQQDSAGSTTASSTDDVDSSNSHIWDGLDPVYKRFLREAGVSRSCYETLPAMEKISLREKYDRVANSLGSKQGLPDWVKQGQQGYILLGAATAEQLLAELHLRLEGQPVKKEALPQDDIEPRIPEQNKEETNIEFIEPEGTVRRGFMV